VTTKKQLDPIPNESLTISGDAEDWIRQFVKHLELHFVDAVRELPPTAGVSDWQVTAARAAFATFLDSGLDHETVLELLGRVVIERSHPGVAWTESLNRRRFELIDKEIQQTLTPAENVELAGLTSMMREHADSEENLPIKGAQDLHRKLLQLDATGESE
jgi:hypothetical protein